jgi:hypothetical protein
MTTRRWPPERPDYGPDGTPKKQVPPGTRDARTGKDIRRPVGGGGGGGGTSHHVGCAVGLLAGAVVGAVAAAKGWRA